MQRKTLQQLERILSREDTSSDTSNQLSVKL